MPGTNDEPPGIDSDAVPVGEPEAQLEGTEVPEDILALLGTDLPPIDGEAAGLPGQADLPPLELLDPLEPLESLDQLVADPLLGLGDAPATEEDKEEAERERMQLLVSHFDEQQMARYAAFRRANIRRAAIRKYASGLLNQPISNSVAVVLAGMSKVLIGDVIELARDLQEKDTANKRAAGELPALAASTEPEPLLPSYIREAWSIYKRETGTVPEPRTRPGSANRFF